MAEPVSEGPIAVPGSSYGTETHRPRRRTALGYALAFSAAVLWGTLGIFAVLIYRYSLDPVVLVTLRAGIAALALLIILCIADRSALHVELKDVPFFIAFGLFSVALNYVSYFEAIARTSATTAVVLLYTSPIFVAIAASFAFGERITAAKGIAFVVTLAGCLLVVGGYDSTRLVADPEGVALGIAAAVTYASYTILSKYSLAKYRSSTTVLYALAFGSLFLIIFSAPRLGQIASLPWRAWILVAAVALGPTLGSYALYVGALNYIEASHAGIVCMAEPVATGILAYVILGERMEGLQVVGAITVVLGVLILQLRPRNLSQSPNDRSTPA
ncbi:MAG: DMT family transporter [Firmicutes bacterium]|nr:DMT family transporter [Bacillota bacterium]